MIKTDPSQTKAVVVLLVVLAGAIVATVLRIHPDAARPAEAAAAAATTQECSVPRVTVTAGPTTRNPFRKPGTLRAAFGRDAQQGIVFATTGVQAETTGPTGSKTDTVRFGLPPGTTIRESQPATTGSTDKPKPQYTLLATVSGPNGLTAVIRIDESSTRIVGVGDILDGRYRVSKLEPGRAVLKNGSDVIEVKRPS